jgi:hypothetical protein
MGSECILGKLDGGVDSGSSWLRIRTDALLTSHLSMQQCMLSSANPARHLLFPQSEPNNTKLTTLPMCATGNSTC